MEPLISVVIPVYNVEKYLKRCLDSIVTQTYKNLEIILVDDGSLDNSGKICDEYAEKDERIVVIHKENGGLSDARNVALEIYNGEYLTFVDSDDFVSVYYIENLYTALEKTGASMSTALLVDFYDGDEIPKFSKITSDKILSLNRQEFLEKMLYQDNVETCACSKLYKSTLFNEIRFPKGKLYEDLATIYKIVHLSEKIALTTANDYIYYQRQNSIQNMTFDVRKMDADAHMTELSNFIKKNYPEISKAADCRCMSMACNIIFQIPKENYPKEWSVLWNRIKSVRKSVLLNSKARKKARFAAMFSYCGYNFLKVVYNIFQNYR